MPFSLLPKRIAEKLTDLTPEYLSACGIRLLMLDFDNTIVPYTTNIPTTEIRNWIEMMRRSDIHLCVVSNSRRERVPRFCEEYGIACVTHAGKPGTGGIHKCLALFNCRAADSALVGDQIFTDTLAANRAGAMSILVKAINNHNFWLKARHVAELPFIFAARRRRIHYEKH